jgi:DNA-binding transcriptional regulator YdaS (Cro superfamily)
MSTLEALQKAIELAGGQSELGRRISAKQQTVHYWVSVMGKAPAEYCRPIEAAVDGQVTRYQLRPDVFGEAPETAEERAA